MNQSEEAEEFGGFKEPTEKEGEEKAKVQNQSCNGNATKLTLSPSNGNQLVHIEFALHFVLAPVDPISVQIHRIAPKMLDETSKWIQTAEELYRSKIRMFDPKRLKNISPSSIHVVYVDPKANFNVKEFFSKHF